MVCWFTASEEATVWTLLSELRALLLKYDGGGFYKAGPTVEQIEAMSQVDGG